MAMEPQPPENPGRAGDAPKAKVPWIPLVLVLLFIPIITVVLVEFVVVPKLQESLSSEGTQTPSSSAEGDGNGETGETATQGAEGNQTATTVQFEEVISNVSGTMGTRFLKVSFQIVSRDPQLEGIVEMREAQVRDAIISTLSSKTIQELEAVGGRNALRVALIGAINEALELDLVEELYFTEFIIQ
jgi:flagellar FliL protein